MSKEYRGMAAVLLASALLGTTAALAAAVLGERLPPLGWAGFGQHDSHTLRSRNKPLRCLSG